MAPQLENDQFANRLAELTSMGFAEDEASVSLRLANGDAERAVSYLIREIEGLDAALLESNSGSQARGDFEETMDVDEVFDPTTFSNSALSTVQSAILSNKYSFYRKGMSLDRCLQTAKHLLQNENACGDTSQVELLNNFIDGILPECVSRHVNPVELRGMEAEAWDCCYEFCCVVIPLLAECLKRPILSGALGRMINELLSYENKYHKATKDKHISDAYNLNRQNPNWVVFSSPESIIKLTGSPSLRLQEFVDDFCNCNALVNINEKIVMLSKAGPTATAVQDLLCLLRIVNSVVPFICLESLEEYQEEWISSTFHVIEDLQEKQIRTSAIRASVLELLEELRRLSGHLWPDSVSDLHEMTTRLDSTRLAFLLKCLRCSQLDARMFALQDIGNLADSLSQSLPCVKESLFNAWLKENGVLQIVLGGNLDMAAYVEKIRPILSHMAVDMTEADLAFVWSLRKGRLGVSADRFISIITYIASRLNAQQIEDLVKLFTKAVASKETRIYDKIFTLCNAIGKATFSPEIAAWVAQCMWDLICVVRKRRYDVVDALRLHADLLEHMKSGELREKYVRIAVDAICQMNTPDYPFSYVCYVRDLMEMGPRRASPQPIIAAARYETRNVTSVRAREDAWGDREVELQRVKTLETLLVERDMFGVLVQKLAEAQRVAHERAADASEFVIPGESSRDGLEDDDECNPLNVLISDGFIYEIVIDEVLVALDWIISSKIISLSQECLEPLWKTFTAPKAAEAEQVKFFVWLSALDSMYVPQKTVCFLLRSFCQLDPASLVEEGVNCLFAFFHRLSRFITEQHDELSRSCVDYQWLLLELTEHVEVVEAVSRKLIETGASKDKQGENHVLFLENCYSQLHRLSSDYFIRKGEEPCRAAEANGTEARCIDTSLPSTSEAVPQEVALGFRNERVALLEERVLLRGIYRLLRLIGRYTETGDEQFVGIRNFPSHGALLPGAPVHVVYSVENDSGEKGGKQEIVTNSHEAIGQFKARLENRLRCKNIHSFGIYTTMEGVEREILVDHPWKTLEQVRMVRPGESKLNSELRVYIVVKPRFGSSSAFRSIGALSKNVSEHYLPSIIISNSAGVFEVLRRLQSIPDEAVQRSCRRLLALIPNELPIENAFRLKQIEKREPPINVDGVDDEMEVQVEGEGQKGAESFCFEHPEAVTGCLNGERPQELLYALEVLAGLLVPVRLTATSVERANQLAAALVHHEVPSTLMNFVHNPNLLATDNYALIYNIYEIIGVILSSLFGGNSVAHKAILNERTSLDQLRQESSRVEVHRKDGVYQDIATLQLDSFSLVQRFDVSACVRCLTSLRNFVWRLTYGWLQTLKGDGMNSKELDSEIDPSSGDFNIHKLLLDIGLKRKESKSIAQDVALTEGYLLQLFQVLHHWLGQNTSKSQGELLEIVMKEETWVKFWTDVLLNTSSPQIRQTVDKHLVRSLKGVGGVHLYPALRTLLGIANLYLFSQVPTNQLDDVKLRQRRFGFDTVFAIADVIELVKNSSNGTIHWKILQLNVDEMACELAEQIKTFEIREVVDDSAFLSQKIKMLTTLLTTNEVSIDIRNQIGDLLIPTLICDKLFPQYQMKEDNNMSVVFGSTRWSVSKLRSLAIRLLYELSDMSGRNSWLIVRWLGEQFDGERLAHDTWDHVPNSEERDLDHVGLKNDGGTCYMNSVLQQLFAIPGLAKQWVQLDVDAKQELDGLKCALVVELQRVMARLLFLRERVCVPRGLWAVFRFTGEDQLDTKQQHDAVDFLTEIIDRCDTVMQKLDLPLLFKPRLEGKFAYEYICYECYNRHQGPLEDFLTVNLELHGCTLEESLQHYVDGEILEGDNAFMCTYCKEKRTTLRRGSFHSVPSTLSIQLKRFTFDFTGRQAQKNNEVCRFPRFLEMGRYMKDARCVDEKDMEMLFDEISSSSQAGPSISVSNSGGLSQSQIPPPSPSSPMKGGRRRRRISTVPSQPLSNPEDYRYELVGVLAHSGLAAAGHYYSFVKEHREEMRDSQTHGQWLELNDAAVRPFSFEEAENSWFGGHFRVPRTEGKSILSTLPEERTRTWNAYVLFYEKVKPAVTQFPTEKETDSVMVPSETSSLESVFHLMPQWLQQEILKENTRFFKERELYSRDFTAVVLKTANNMMEWLESEEEELCMEDSADKAIQLFRLLFPYCCNVLWKLCSSVRDPNMSKSREIVSKYLFFHQDMRDMFLDFVANKDFKLFDEYAATPVADVFSLWWSLVGITLEGTLSDPHHNGHGPDQMPVEFEVLQRTLALINGDYLNYFWKVAQLIEMIHSLSKQKGVNNILLSMGIISTLSQFAVIWDGNQVHSRIPLSELLETGHFHQLPDLFVQLLFHATYAATPDDVSLYQQMCQPTTQWYVWWLYCNCQQPSVRELAEKFFSRLDMVLPREMTNERMNYLLKWLTGGVFSSDNWFDIVGAVFRISAINEDYCDDVDGLDDCTYSLDVLFDAREREAAENSDIHSGLILWMEDQECEGNYDSCHSMLQAVYSALNLSPDASPLTRAAFDQRLDRINGIRRKLEEHQRFRLNEDALSDTAGGFTVEEDTSGDMVSGGEGSVTTTTTSSAGSASTTTGLEQNQEEQLSYGSATALVTSSSDLDLSNKLP